MIRLFRKAPFLQNKGFIDRPLIFIAEHRQLFGEARFAHIDGDFTHNPVVFRNVCFHKRKRLNEKDVSSVSLCSYAYFATQRSCRNFPF